MEQPASNQPCNPNNSGNSDGPCEHFDEAPTVKMPTAIPIPDSLECALEKLGTDGCPIPND